jgi:hypothetical protein
MTAKTAFVLWLLLQLLLAYSQIHGLTHVSALGHLGLKQAKGERGREARYP